MLRIITCITAILIIAFTTACNRQSDESAASQATVTDYKSEKHTFDVTFPAGSKAPAVKPDKTRGDNDVSYATSNKDGSYAIRVIKMESVNGSMQEVLERAGVKFPNDAKVRSTGVQTRPAMEYVGWLPSGKTDANGDPEKMYERLLAFRAENGSFYVVTYTADSELKMNSPEANDFFNSIKVPRPVGDQQASPEQTREPSL